MIGELGEVHMPKMDFKLINVVDVVRPNPRRDDLQIFKTNGPDLNVIKRLHADMIETTILWSKKQIVINEQSTFGRRELHCISGFMERYGRLPTMDDKIQIIATDFFRIDHRPGMFYITSELDFNLLT